MAPILPTIRGRGTNSNPQNRFEKLALEPDLDLIDEQGILGTTTTYLKDISRTIIAHNDSPDVGFTYSINPYRGCSHGCIYCYARPTHEYLGFSAGLDFETKIMVKENAPQLLRAELMSHKWRPQVLSISGVTDCYQPAERKLELTRRCLQVLAEFRNPVGVITKSHLITRDTDVLGELASHNAAVAILSVTTLDPELSRRMEPRASAPARRLDAISQLARAGIPVGVMLAPVVPALTDHEMPMILQAAADAGARFAGYVPVRLPLGVAPLFEQWLQRHYPDRKDKVLNRIRSMRNGKLNESTFHDRMRGHGPFADQMSTLFEAGKRKAGIGSDFPQLSTHSFRRPDRQLSLFSV